MRPDTDRSALCEIVRPRRDTRCSRSSRTVKENLEKSWNLKNGYIQAWKSRWKNQEIVKSFGSHRNVFHSYFNSHGIYTVCFGILIVSLNITFSHFFVFPPEISQYFWSWKFGLRSWKSPGNPFGPNEFKTLFTGSFPFHGPAPPCSSGAVFCSSGLRHRPPECSPKVRIS